MNDCDKIFFALLCIGELLVIAICVIVIIDAIKDLKQ